MANVSRMRPFIYQSKIIITNEEGNYTKEFTELLKDYCL
jgi:tRNA1(Val) A37 N6-methylase TrmN6